jgi:hypothetical protein
MKSAKSIFVKIFFLTIIFSIRFQVSAQTDATQDDPVMAPNVSTIPVIDGIADDACWQSAKWQVIGQVWIPYGGSVTSTDYSGRYKVIWSSSTNLLYFLVEISDDVFVDGFDKNNANGAIYDYDISEVFIDENKSGGEHRNDGPTTNAENAFAYHMYAAYPSEGQVTTKVYVDDQAGTSSSSYRPDYSSHFPEFALRKTGNTAIREFSLIVYNDTYTESNKDAARAILQVDKIMGLSVAYCDNDGATEKPKVRDNMFGSVKEPSPGNLHWMNADYFGRIKLVAEGQTGITNETSVRNQSGVKIYPNPASSISQIQIDDFYTGRITLRLFNIIGQEVFRKELSKSSRIFSEKFVWNRLSPGTYFLSMQMGNSIHVQKLIISRTK